VIFEIGIGVMRKVWHKSRISDTTETNTRLCPCVCSIMDTDLYAHYVARGLMHSNLRYIPFAGVYVCFFVHEED